MFGNGQHALRVVRDHSVGHLEFAALVLLGQRYDRHADSLSHTRQLARVAPLAELSACLRWIECHQSPSPGAPHENVTNPPGKQGLPFKARCGMFGERQSSFDAACNRVEHPMKAFRGRFRFGGAAFGFCGYVISISGVADSRAVTLVNGPDQTGAIPGTESNGCPGNGRLRHRQRVRFINRSPPLLGRFAANPTARSAPGPSRRSAAISGRGTRPRRTASRLRSR